MISSEIGRYCRPGALPGRPFHRAVCQGNCSAA